MNEHDDREAFTGKMNVKPVRPMTTQPAAPTEGSGDAARAKL